MPNRIKDIFNNDMFNMSTQLRFKDEVAYQSFLTALETVQKEGCAVPIDGISSISTEINNQGTKYPVVEHTSVSQFVVYPSFEPFTIRLQVGDQEKELVFWRNIARNKTVVKTDDNAVVFFEFSFFPNENKHTITYKTQYDKATTIEEVVEAFCVANALLTKLYNPEPAIVDKKDAISITNVKNYFRHHEAFLRRLSAVEKELEVSFSPSLLNDLPLKQQQDIDEVYVLLILHKMVRLNGKLTSTESTSITVDEKSFPSSVGSAIELTFSGTIDYSFLEQTVRLYTANLLTNAIVKEILKESDGKVKLLYGDTDSKPMYISFSAFKTKEEASSELKTIMEKKDTYLNAPTSASYIAQFYSD